MEAVIGGKTVLCGNRKLLERHGINLTGFTGTPGSTEVLLAQNGQPLGHIVIADTVKADAKQAMDRMQAQGLTTAHADRRRTGNRRRGRARTRHP